jgi:ribosomal protein L19E
LPGKCKSLGSITSIKKEKKKKRKGRRRKEKKGKGISQGSLESQNLWIVSI